MKPIKFLSISLIIILIINLVFLAMGLIGPFSFFAVLAVAGLIAFKGIPYIKKK